MSIIKEFRAFTVRGNVIELAVAVVLGGAFGRIVTAVVEGLVMPVVAALTPGGTWREWSVTPLGLKVGSVLGATIDFLVVALVVFLVVNKLLARKGPVVVTSKTCQECLEVIPLAARRCRACGEAVLQAA
ncbi:MAG: large conductance mechanosensitive channel protein MscL [Archangium sp.]|nr:large conductance mechanosensitive channel protein MscL [Archangium sp.]